MLVLDDAFQHRRIARDLDIVLLDALEPLGYEHVFPRGTLREPVEGLARADVVALSRADLLTAGRAERSAIAWRSCRRRRHGSRSCMRHWHWWRSEAPERQAGRLHYRRRRRDAGHAAAAGNASRAAGAGLLRTGQPGRLPAYAEVCGYDVVEFHEFPDHHAYGPGDLEALAAAARQTAAEALVCTQKDLVKIGVDRLGDRPLWAIRVGIDFLAGREVLERKLLSP